MKWLKAIEWEGEQNREVEFRGERLRERHGKALEHRKFSKENNSFINKQQLSFFFLQVSFYRNKRRAVMGRRRIAVIFIRV